MKNIKIKLIYFTTESKNTLNFVSRLTDFESIRIPENGDLLIDTPYVLVFPSYGGGKDKGSVPAPVIKFIMNGENQKNIIGIIGSGDRNYGDKFCIGSRILSKKLQVPLLYEYEIRGTDVDIQNVKLGLLKIEENLNKKLGE
jgi:protein involved in ribonucleotide reduction